MRIRVLAPSLALLALLAMPAAGQPAPAPTSRIPTVTRLVKVFSEVESRLTASLAAGDLAALEQAVDADFELRVGSTPGTPIPRADWIRQSTGKPGSASIDQMAVHDFGSVAVVSFRQADAGAPGAPRNLFVVDCWKRVGDGWKLVTRYLSDAAAPALPAPASPPIDKRY